MANVFVAFVIGGTGMVQFNYTIPKYSAYKEGYFIFEREQDFLLAKGIRKLVYTGVVNLGNQ